MDYHKGKHRLLTASGDTVHDQSCQVALTDDDVRIAPETADEIVLYYSDIDRVLDQDWQLELTMFDGTRHIIYFLGAVYGQFKADLLQRRQAQLIPNLLMLDTGKGKEFRGAYEYTDSGGQHSRDKTARVLLYDTSFVVLPESADPFNVAYSSIEQMKFDPVSYSLNIRLDLGETLSLSMLGQRFSELEADIQSLTANMYERTAAFLGEQMPHVPAATLKRLAETLRQGRAVSRVHVEAVDAALWDSLLALVFASEGEGAGDQRRSAFDYLAGRSGPQHVYVGVREAARGKGAVYWFLIALPEDNAIAAEVTSESGHATYLYRIAEHGRPDEAEVAHRVRELSRAMQALNFRREVISASAGDIAGERFARYRVALRKLPYLRRTREAFLGRAAHTGQEAWQRRVETILGQATAHV